MMAAMMVEVGRGWPCRARRMAPPARAGPACTLTVMDTHTSKVSTTARPWAARLKVLQGRFERRRALVCLLNTKIQRRTVRCSCESQPPLICGLTYIPPLAIQREDAADLRARRLLSEVGLLRPRPALTTPSTHPHTAQASTEPGGRSQKNHRRHLSPLDVHLERLLLLAVEVHAPQVLLHLRLLLLPLQGRHATPMGETSPSFVTRAGRTEETTQAPLLQRMSCLPPPSRRPQATGGTRCGVVAREAPHRCACTTTARLGPTGVASCPGPAPSCRPQNRMFKALVTTYHSL